MERVCRVTGIHVEGGGGSGGGGEREEEEEENERFWCWLLMVIGEVRL